MSRSTWMCESDEPRQNLASDIIQCLWERLQPRQNLASDIIQCLWERLQPRRLSHGLAAGISFFRNASLRCALLPEKKIPPAALTNIAGARYRCARSSVVRSAATQDAKASGERSERGRDAE